MMRQPPRPTRAATPFPATTLVRSYLPAPGPVPAPRLLETACAKPPLRPGLAFVRQPAWDTADPEMQEGCAELVAALGEGCEEVDLPKHFGEAMKLCELVQLAELAKSFDHYARRGRDPLSPEMRQAIDDGNRVLASDDLAARDWPKLLNYALAAVFAS